METHVFWDFIANFVFIRYLHRQRDIFTWKTSQCDVFLYLQIHVLNIFLFQRINCRRRNLPSNVTWIRYQNPPEDSRIGYLPLSRIWGSDRDRCSVQCFSFKVCVGPWIINGEGETWRCRDPKPFWRLWNSFDFQVTSRSSQKWKGTYLCHYLSSWVH